MLLSGNAKQWEQGGKNRRKRVLGRVLKIADLRRRNLGRRQEGASNLGRGENFLENLD